MAGVAEKERAARAQVATAPSASSSFSPLCGYIFHQDSLFNPLGMSMALM